MNIEELEKCDYVKNIKYGTIEQFRTVGKMKMESGNWVDCAIYAGQDRFTGKETIFCKRIEDFIKEFECVYDISEEECFKEYMKGVYSQLECNMSEEEKRQNPYNCFIYSEKYIKLNELFFIQCFVRGISQYTALNLFGGVDEEYSNN